MSFTYFLNYCASNPDAEIVYNKSDMMLPVENDTTYLVASKSRIREAGYFDLGKKDGKLFNGTIFVLAKVIKAVMASVAEA